jgi:hypothetical protein
MHLFAFICTQSAGHFVVDVAVHHAAVLNPYIGTLTDRTKSFVGTPDVRDISMLVMHWHSTALKSSVVQFIGGAPVTTYRTEHEVYSRTITALPVTPRNNANLQVTEIFSLFRRNDSCSALRLPRSFIRKDTWRHKSDWTPIRWIIAWVTACCPSFAEQFECPERDEPAYACNEYTTSTCHFVQRKSYSQSDMQFARWSYSTCNHLNWIILHSKQLRCFSTLSTIMIDLCTYAYCRTSIWRPGQLMNIVAAGTLDMELHTAVYWSILGDCIKKENLHCISLQFDKVCTILLRPWDPGIHEIRHLIEMTSNFCNVYLLVLIGEGHMIKPLQCLQCISLGVDWRRRYDQAIAWGQAMFLGGSSVTPVCCLYVGPEPHGLWATGRDGLESTKDSRAAAVRVSNRTG